MLMRSLSADLPRAAARRLVSIGGLALVGTVAVACGSDDGASNRSDVAVTGTTTAGTTPEQQQSSDTEVAAGLGALPTLVATAVATVGTPAATAAFEPIEASWRTYEGTVRSKEQDIYLAIEDGFANLQTALADGDAATAKDAETTISAAADQYLAKHP